MEKNKYEKQIIKLGLVIKELRINQKITQQHLSILCEVDVRTIQRIEKGKQNISLTLLLSLADQLNIKADSLINKAIEHTK